MEDTIKIFSNSDIHLNSQSGERFRLEHVVNGVVIHLTAVIGNDCRMFFQTTVSISDLKNIQAAHTGDNAIIVKRTKIIGNEETGNNVKVKIGANAVIIKNLPDYSGAVDISDKS